jgi:hypothetical protein
MGMNGWTSLLRADPVPWLLGVDNPSVRFLTLVDILGKPPGGGEALEAKKAIMARGLVPRILARMNPGGYWETEERFYTAKYKGTAWQLIVLAEMSADGADKRIRAARDFLLERSQDRESGGFAHRHGVRTGGGSHSEVIPCLTGNMVYAMIKLGYLDDPGVGRGIDWINRYQRFDDRTSDPPRGWPYERYEMCWGRHTCHMGAAKALKALAEIPAAKRSADTRRTLEMGAEYFLKHHIFKRSHDLAKVSRPGWLRLGYPLMYQTDILEVLGILTRLGYRDQRMREALDAVIRGQDDHGRWTLASTFNGRFQVNVEVRGKASKWITLNALRVLRRFYAQPR